MARLQLPDPPKIRATNFRPQTIQAMNPLRGGHHQAVEMGETVWMCDIETTPLSRSQGGSWKWLLAKLRGAINTLMLYDASRPRPLAYHSSSDGSAPKIGRSKLIGAPRLIASVTRAWGSPKIVEVDRANRRIRVTGFTAGATISDGDYGHWDDGPARRLFICEEATADAAGGCWITVEPAPPETSAYLPALFEMNRASGEFVVMQASAPYSAPVTHSVTLQAAQVLRRS